MTARLAMLGCVLLVLVSAACRGRRAQDAPRRLEFDRTLSGEAERGYGAAVAFVGEDLYIGEPWQGTGRVHGPAGVVLTGEGADRLGETLLGGEELIVGAPARGEGAGALVGLDGGLVRSGQAGQQLGGSPVRLGEAVIALDRDAVVGEDSRWELPGPAWSLVAGSLSRDGDAIWIAGLRGGGLAWEGGTAGVGGTASGALGRGLALCDLDRDGDEDLVVADPVGGSLRLYVLDDLGALDLDAPTVGLELGAGAGRSVACLNGGLVVGAPDLPDGGAIAWIRRPLEPEAASQVQWLRGGGGSSLGHSLAIGPDRTVAAGDPGLGQVRVFVGR